MTKSSLIMFKAYPIQKHLKEISADQKGRIKKVNAQTIPLGYAISPEVIAMFDDITKVRDNIESNLVTTGNQWNAAFHKSWKKIATESDRQLALEQAIHYMSTYGRESFGWEYNKFSVYIPAEELKIPGIKEGVPILYIRGITREELKAQTMGLVSSGVALGEETMRMVVTILKAVGFGFEDIARVKNKEVRIHMYRAFDLIPDEQVEFLRYLIYAATETTLIVKSPALIAKIKTEAPAKHTKLAALLNEYNKQYSLAKLSQVFYRYKPLWLAFRTGPKLRAIINSMRRLAVTNHKPMPEDFLNNITAYIQKGLVITKDQLTNALDKVNLFRQIRLLYSLHYRNSAKHDAIVYKVRNGKAWATELKHNNSVAFPTAEAMVMDSIVERLEKKVDGRWVLMPKLVDYALPATEKQFTGNLPSGTIVKVPRNMIFGVHWTDQPGPGRDENGRIDLDLSLTSISGEKFGWDARRNSEQGDILFSGDMTAAPKPLGASELFFVRKLNPGVYMLACNYFNHDEEVPVPFQIVIAQENSFKGFYKGDTRPTKPYMLDPNKIVATANSVMDKHQKILGTLTVSDKGCTFAFSEMDMGNSRTLDPDKEYVKQTQQYLHDFYNDSVRLKDVLIDAGAIIAYDKEHVPPKTEFIDLSIENIQKDTILSLLS